MINIETLYQVVSALEEEYCAKNNARKEKWKRSKFQYLTEAAAGTKGAIGKKLVAILCKKCGFDVKSKTKTKNKPPTDAVFEIDNIGIAVKFAMLDESNGYVFEQIRNRDYRIIVLLGISPDDASVWAFRREECFRCMRHQHNENDRWAHVKPGNPPQWTDLREGELCVTGQSGRLEDFSAVLSGKIAECH